MKKMPMIKKRLVPLFFLKPSLKIKLTALFALVSIIDMHSENYFRKTNASNSFSLNLNSAITDNKKIYGIVRDNNGLPLIGVTILVNDNKKGTLTDFDGKYEINVNEGDVVSFSYLGFVTKNIKITSQYLLDVTLEPISNELNELVLVGYGKMERDKIPGAVTKLDTKVLQNTQNVNFADALIGVVPGLLVRENRTGSFDAAPEVLLRGIGSLRADTSPLIVLDGVQMPGLKFSLDATDIQDLSVLKDAAATSIYGSKGSNGVILITTKRGKRNSKIQVNFNSRLGIKYADKSFTKDLMNASQKLDFEESLGFYKKNPALLQKRRDIGNDLVWADLLLKNEVNRENVVSISGGSDKANYYSSITYNKVDGISSSQYKRYTATMRVDFDLGSKLKVGLSGNFGNVKTDAKQSAGFAFSNVFLLNPWLAIYDDKGDPLPILDVGASSSPIPYNPLFIRDNTNANSSAKNIVGTATIKYSPAKWLTLDGSLGANYDVSKGNSYENVKVRGGALSYSNSDSSNYTATLTATIAKKFQKHSFDLVLGNEINEYQTNRLSLSAVNFDSDGIQTISAGKEIVSLNDLRSHGGLLSYFSRLNYTFNDIYNLALSFRRDGSSRFGAKNKYANFWSIGSSWNIQKNLFKESKLVSSLKLRASIGTSGNDFIGDFDSLSLYQYRDENYAGSTVPYLSRGENPNLTWEKNFNKNIGIDYGFLNNRISGTVDYYIRDTNDLLNNKPLPLSSGFEGLISNIGNFRNEGVEISLHLINFKNKNFTWTTDFNIAINKGTVLSLSDDSDMISWGGSSTVFKAGSAIRSFNIADWAGVNPLTGFNQYRSADGELVDYITSETKLNTAEIEKMRHITNKTALPKYHGGLTNTLNFKNFDMSFLISYAAGHYVMNDALYSLYNDPSKNQAVKLFDAWKKPGDQSDLAIRQVSSIRPTSSMISDYKESSQFLENASYIKLKNITLGYTIDKRATHKIGIENLRFFVQGQNLFTKTAVSYTDPEHASPSGSIGFTSTVVRGYSFGLNADF